MKEVTKNHKVFRLCEISGIGKPIRTESKLVVAEILGEYREGIKSGCERVEVSFWGHENVLQLNCVLGNRKKMFQWPGGQGRWREKEKKGK